MTAAAMITGGRLRPVSVGGARLGRPTAWALVGLLVLVTLLAVFARPLAPYNPIQPVGPLNLAPLSPGHLLGTDGIGRDLLSRTLIGIQVSWLSALVIVASGLLIGGAVGLIAGATGGWVDTILMRVTDLFLALPGALVAIAIVAALGSGLVNTLIGVAWSGGRTTHASFAVRPRHWPPARTSRPPGSPGSASRGS